MLVKATSHTSFCVDGIHPVYCAFFVNNHVVSDGKHLVSALRLRRYRFVAIIQSYRDAILLQ